MHPCPTPSWRFLLHLLLAGAASGGVLASAWGAGITVGVAETPLSTPVFVAEKQGYFRDEGLDVVLLECPTGAACLKQLLEAKVQLATASDLPIMLRSFEAVPFKVLATFATSSQDVKLLTRKNSGVKITADLKGKQIALVRGSSAQYVLDLTLLAAGLDPRAITTVDLDPKRLSQAVANPQIDAFALFQPGANQLLKLLGADAVTVPIPNMYTLTFNLVTLRDASGLSEDQQFKMLRALDRAVNFIKVEPAASMGILREHLKMDAADVAALWPNYRFALNLNQSLIATLESTARWAIQEKLVKAVASPNYLDFIEVRPLKRVRPSAVTLIK
jgi:ABC-type nitrate/sulfonate/bicarbonate transport system substrate-binding protein